MADVDPTLLRLAKEVIRPGNVVWDIGANLGLFSFAAATLAGSGGYVLAVEPDVLLVRLLRRSAAANQAYAPVNVLPAAVSDIVGVANFHIARRNRATNHLDGFGTGQTGGIRSTELVPTVTMDWLAGRFPIPDVVKIDVETAELKVLASAGSVLQTSPTVICEVAGGNAEAVGNLLGGCGYTLYDGDQSADQRIPRDVAPYATLAINHQSSSPRASCEPIVL